MKHIKIRARLSGNLVTLELLEQTCFGHDFGDSVLFGFTASNNVLFGFTASNNVTLCSSGSFLDTTYIHEDSVILFFPERDDPDADKIKPTMPVTLEVYAKIKQAVEEYNSHFA